MKLYERLRALRAEQLEETREFLFFLPLLAGSLWSVAGLFLGGPSGWAMLLALAGVLVLTVWLPGRRPRLLALGGGALLAAGLLLACCLYVSEAPSALSDLTEIQGTVSAVRTSAAKRIRPDHQIVLEDGEVYWLSGVCWGGTALPLRTGDEVRLLCTAEKRGSIYELEINGETILPYETARIRTEENRSLLWAVVLLTLMGLGLHFLNEAGRSQRPRPDRRHRRRR